MYIRIGFEHSTKCINLSSICILSLNVAGRSIGPQSSAAILSQPLDLNAIKISFLELLYHEIRCQYFGKGPSLPQKQKQPLAKPRADRFTTGRLNLIADGYFLPFLQL